MSASNLFESYPYNRTSYPLDTHLPIGNLAAITEGRIDGRRSLTLGSKELAQLLLQAHLEAVPLLKRHQVQWFHLLTQLEEFPS